MSSIKSFAYKKRDTLIIFASMCVLWAFGRGYIAGDIENADIYLPQYYLDLKAGPVSRTFIGTLLGFITDNNITIGSIKALIYTNEAVCILIFSTLAGSFVENFRSKAASFFAAFAVVSYYSVIFFLTGLWPSVFDHYWFTVFMLCLLCMKKKYTKIVIPLLVFIGLWINYGFSLCLFPVIMILLYYCMVYGKDRKWNTFIFSFTAVSGASATVYFVFFANKFLKMDIEALHEYIENRMGSLPCSFHGIDAYLYGTLGDKKVGSGFIDIFFKDYEGLQKEGFSLLIGQSAVISGLVIMLCFAAFWGYMFVKNKDVRLRFAAFFNICLLPVSVISCMISGDNSRFMAFGIIANTVSICTALYFEDIHIETFTGKIEGFLSGKAPFAGVVCILFIIYSEFFRNAGWQLLLCTAAFFVSLILMLRGRDYISCLISSAASVFFADYLVCFAVPAFVLTFYDGMLRKDKKAASHSMFSSSAEMVTFVICTIYRLATGRMRFGFISLSSLKTGMVISACAVIVFTVFMIALFIRAGLHKGVTALLCVLSSAALVFCFMQFTGLTGLYYNVSAAMLICVPVYLCFSEHKEMKAFNKLLCEAQAREAFLTYSVPAVILSAVI